MRIINSDAVHIHSPFRMFIILSLVFLLTQEWLFVVACVGAVEWKTEVTDGKAKANQLLSSQSYLSVNHG